MVRYDFEHHFSKTSDTPPAGAGGILEWELQLPLFLFLLVLHIGENFLFVQADTRYTVASGPDALSGEVDLFQKRKFRLKRLCRL